MTAIDLYLPKGLRYMNIEEKWRQVWYKPFLVLPRYVEFNLTPRLSVVYTTKPPNGSPLSSNAFYRVPILSVRCNSPYPTSSPYRFIYTVCCLEDRHTLKTK